MDRRIQESRRQEARGAQRHGGRVQPGSGSGRYNKGDVKTEFELIEYKRTDGKSIVVKAADLALHRQRALLANRIPFFGIEVGGHDYLIVSEYDLDIVVERRAREIAIQRGLGDAGPTESGVQSTSEVRRSGKSPERSVLSRAAPVSQGSARQSDDAADDGRGVEGLLPRPNVPRGPRVPGAPRMFRVVNGELAEARDMGRTQRAGALQAEGSARTRGRISRVIGGDKT